MYTQDVILIRKADKVVKNIKTWLVYESYSYF